MATPEEVQRALECNAILAQCADEALAAGDVPLAVRYHRRLGRSLMALLELAAGAVEVEGMASAGGPGGAWGAPR